MAHVFIIARDTDTRLRVPMRVKKYEAKRVYGADMHYPTRKECQEAILQDQVFEYVTRDNQKLLATPELIRKHCKLLCSTANEDFNLSRYYLRSEYFKLKLDMGDLLVSVFANMFWICDCGDHELWIYEKDGKAIERKAAQHIIEKTQREIKEIESIHFIRPMDSYLKPPADLGGPVFKLSGIIEELNRLFQYGVDISKAKDRFDISQQ